MTLPSRPGNPSRMSRPAALAPLLVLTLLAFSTAAAQQATVSGRVVESGTRTGILGAAIELPGRVPALTGADGTFEITGVASGSYTLRVEALGYARASLDLVFRATLHSRSSSIAHRSSSTRSWSKAGMSL